MARRGRMRRAIRARKYITSQKIPHQELIYPRKLKKYLKQYFTKSKCKHPKQDARALVSSVELEIAKIGTVRGIAVMVKALNLQMFASSMDRKEKDHAIQ